jgi:hypothetical protein
MDLAADSMRISISPDELVVGQEQHDVEAKKRQAITGYMMGFSWCEMIVRRSKGHPCIIISSRYLAHSA